MIQYSNGETFHRESALRRITGTACHRGMWKSGTHLLRWEEGDNSNNHNHITMSQCRLGGLVLTGRCATCACSLCSREDKHSISKDHWYCTLTVLLTGYYVAFPVVKTRENKCSTIKDHWYCTHASLEACGKRDLPPEVGGSRKTSQCR